MPSSRYALVTYVRNPVGEFVEELRRQLHPTTPHMPAHLTILPPRELTGSEAAALEFLEEEFPASDERDEIVAFIRESGRGIIKRYSKSSLDEDYAD